jgi:hypothetical protein
MPPPKPQKTGSGGGLDWILIVVAVIAVGALGFFGVSRFFGEGSAQPTQGPVIALAATEVTWTEDDAARCDKKARAEMKAARDGSSGSLNPSLAPDFAGLAVGLECRIATRPERFCDEGQRTALVAEVKDYLNRIDLIIAGLNLQGAPLKLLGSASPEVAFGSAIYDLITQMTVDSMEKYHERVAGELKQLVRDGIVKEDDFGAFLGMGVPPMIKKMFAGVSAQRNICA